MLKNYLLVSFRTLWRYKLFSFINIGGLTLALSACLLIFLFVENELSYDSWIPEHERVYRLEGVYYSPDRPPSASPLSPGALTKPMTADFSNIIEKSSRLLREGFVVKSGVTRFIETGWLADPDFFDVIDLPMAAGDRAALFKGYDSVIISERMAKKYFGEEPAIGKIFDLDTGARSVTVVGVMKDIPENSHLDMDFLLHFNEADYANRPWIATYWLASNFFAYLKLREGASPEQLISQLPDYLDKNAVTNSNTPLLKSPGETLKFNLVPVTDVHLKSQGSPQIKPTGDINVVYGFTGIAILILLIAVFNFTNLSTARASLRAKEVSLRKVVGASRRSIITQFLTEALIVVAIALLMALLIVELALPWFNEFVTKLLSLDLFGDPLMALGMAGILVVLGLSAGTYPAFKLSSYRPAEILHSGRQAAPGSVRLRTVLTMLQFTIAIGLMITTAVIYAQLNYARQMDAGFEKARKMVVRNLNFGPVANVADTIKTEIERLPGVNTTALSDRPIPLRGYWDAPVNLNVEGRDINIQFERVPADFEFLNVYGARLVAGRFFSRDRRADLPTEVSDQDGLIHQSALISETTVRELGFARPDHAIGKVLRLPRFEGGYADTQIIGVIQDMYLRSLRTKIDAALFILQESDMGILNIDLVPGLERETQNAIEAIWNRHVPDIPFSYGYVDEDFNVFYEADEQRAKVFAYFSLFAILVSCLGLYGLASFTAERRVREIGVRKVLGASIPEIVRLLTFDFSRPVLLANIIAWPAAWYFTSEWLNGFEYRIDLSIHYFLLAGGLALVIAILTVAGHAIKTARANPILALRHE